MPSTDTIRLAAPFSPHSFRGTWYRLVYTEAFRRLGLKFQYVQLPLRRATFMAQQGALDGETGRVGAYQGSTDRLVKVPVVLWHARFVAVASSPTLQVDSWQSLGRLNGIIDYRRGVWLVEQRLRQYVPSKRLNAVSGPLQALERLQWGRCQVYVDVDQVVGRAMGQARLNKLPLYIAGVVAREPIYPFLSKKNRALAPHLAQTLRKMRQDGLFRQYTKMAQEQTLNGGPDPAASGSP